MCKQLFDDDKSWVIVIEIDSEGVITLASLWLMM